MSIFVGVDAGGSSTRILAERDGTSLGAFDGAPANLRRGGVDGAASTIAHGIESLLRGVDPDVVMVGAAGAGTASLARALQTALSARLTKSHVFVDDDGIVALRAGVLRGDGIVLVAGTGSLAMAVHGEQRFRAGGHGFLLDDAGSGAWIGASAVRLLLRAFDERSPRDAMLDTIAQALQARSISEVHEAIYTQSDPVQKLASLAPFVIEAASTGDRGATKIVQGAALELSELLRNVARRAHLVDVDTTIVLAGGLLSGNSLLTFLLETRIANELPHARICKGVDPAMGALALARERSTNA